MKLKIGSRGSALAMAQSKIIVDRLEREHPKLKCEIVPFTTTGDRILDKTLDKIGGKGLFVKELELALLEGSVDLTIHSLKDMPMEVDERLPILAVSERENPFDVLVLPKNVNEIDFSKPIGTSSKRREVQIRKIFPNCEVKPVRGNVITRLEKLDSGLFSGLILAYAGLKRLGLENRISRVFSEKDMVPSGCQGVLAVQGKVGFDTSVLEGVHCEKTFSVIKSERTFLSEVGGGCSAPIGVYGIKIDENISLSGMMLDSSDNIIKLEEVGLLGNSLEVGSLLAEKYKKIL